MRRLHIVIERQRKRFKSKGVSLLRDNAIVSLSKSKGIDAPCRIKAWPSDNSKTEYLNRTEAHHFCENDNGEPLFLLNIPLVRVCQFGVKLNC